MFERLRSHLWPADLGPRLREWTADRSEYQTEGERLLEQADYAGAELKLAQAVLDGERRQQPAGKRILLLLELAEAQRKQVRPGAADGDAGKLAMAEQTIRSALDLATKTGEQALVVQCLDALAAILADEGSLEEAVRRLQDATRVESGIKRRDPQTTTRRLQRLARLHHARGQSQAGVEAMTECLAMHEKTLGADHPETAQRMSELAALHHALGQHSEAQRYLRRALQVHEREGGLESAEAVSDIQLLTESYDASGNIDAAAALQERALAWKLRTVGAKLDEIAGMQASLAQRYIGWRRYARARELLMEAVGTFKRTGGAALALGYESLAQIEEETGHYHDALRELGRAGTVWESMQPQHAEATIRNLEHRIFLLTQLRQHEDAEFLRSKAAALMQAARWTAAG